MLAGWSVKHPVWKAVKVPAGKVLVTFSSDWFSYESFYRVHEGEVELRDVDLVSARLLDDGQSLDVVVKIRNDDRESWTVENRRVTNRGGKAVDELLRTGVVTQ